MPRMSASFPAGSVTGAGAGAVPGAGSGYAVVETVENVMLPSTLDMTWWMWPLSTVTEAKRFRYESAWAASSVPQPHFSEMVHIGTWAKTTIAVSDLGLA